MLTILDWPNLRTIALNTGTTGQAVRDLLKAALARSLAESIMIVDSVAEYIYM
jgi:hypothetical protein